MQALVIALALAPVPSLAQDFDAGLAAAQAGDYATALRECQSARMLTMQKGQF